MQCLRCHFENQEQNFCGVCGAPLGLEDFVALQVRSELEKNTRERDLVERESAIRIFEKVQGYVKTFAFVALAITVPFAALGVYKWSDLISAINSAKQSVIESAASERKAIAATSVAAQHALEETSSNTGRESKVAVFAVNAAKGQVGRDAVQVEAKIRGLNKQLEDAGKLQVEMVSIREELTKQQKVLSSSEEFAKQLFSSHQAEFFQPGRTPQERCRILPRKNGNGATVYLVLSKVPIAQTLQLQYHVFSQPKNSYICISNLVVFSWGDPADNLNAHELTASYFPDNSTRNAITALSEKEGRVYADGEPLFRFGEVDPGFAGNKWVSLKAQ